MLGGIGQQQDCEKLQGKAWEDMLREMLGRRAKTCLL